MQARRNNSAKRQAILNALCSSTEHPTAEALYSMLKPDYPELSLGTIYRNLSIFVEEGLAVSVGKINGSERYDACVTPHSHFACRACNRVLDVSVEPELDELVSQISQIHNYSTEDYSVMFFGLCDRCRA